ncbi:MAG: restriction endonuclease subunit S [Candidatus Peribacteria bacterium]|nr:restriction endonuclease subunit S [Candidatus Peribacteria bacterium]
MEKDYNKKLILTENCAKLMIRDTTKILPKFLEIILNLDIVQKQFNANFSQATIAKLSIERLRQIKIPVLPPLEVQNQIVAKMDKALAIKKQKEQEAKVLLESIDDFMLDELGIEYKEVKEEKIFGLKLSELGEMKRFDVENYKGVPKFSSKYACAKIRDIATINPARKKPSFKEDETVPYV